MSKKKKIWILAISLVFVLAIAGMVFSLVYTNTLKKPVLYYNQTERRVEWSEIKYADRYILTDNGVEITVYDTAYQPDTYGYHKISVKAESDRKRKLDSATAEIEIHYEAASLPFSVAETGSGIPLRKYYRYARGGGLMIDFDTRGGPVVSASAIGLNPADIEIEEGRITLSERYMAQFSLGANIALTLFFADGSFQDYVIQVTDKIVPQITENSHYVYQASVQKYSGEALSIEFDRKIEIEAITVNTKYGFETGGQYFAKSNNSIYILPAFFDRAKAGLHTLIFHEKNAEIVFYLNITNETAEIFDLRMEFDLALAGKTGYLFWYFDYAYDDVYFLLNTGGEKIDSRMQSDRFSVFADGRFGMDLTGISIPENKLISLFVCDIDTDEIIDAAQVTYQQPTKEQRVYIEEYFTYFGTSYNLFISNAHEMEILIHYMILYNDLLDKKLIGFKNIPTLTFYVQDQYIVQNFVSEVIRYIGTYREAVKLNYHYSALGGNVFRLSFDLVSARAPDGTSGQTGIVKEQGYYPSFTLEPRAKGYDSFAINSVGQTMAVRTSDELYLAVEAGFRPVIQDAGVQKIYDAALDVLRQIIDDSMNDYQKVTAIYDWLCLSIVYDYKTEDEMDGIPPTSSLYDRYYARNCFYLEGVFLEGLAVCNGLTKAFVLLCGIEGIQAVKVNGTATRYESAHAWNKVRIAGVWYICDPTWGIKKVSGSGAEVIDHSYLLISEAQLLSLDRYRVENEGAATRYIANDGVVDMYANMYFVVEVDGMLQVHDFVMDSIEEVRIFVQYLLQSGKTGGFAVKIKLVPFQIALPERPTELFARLCAEAGLQVVPTHLTILGQYCEAYFTIL